MKRRDKVIIGVVIVLGGLAVAFFFASTRIVGLPGSRTNDGSRAVTDGGVKIPGWNGKIDPAEQRAGMTLDDARLAQEGDALHITTGPATTYWMSNATAAGDFTVKAIFTEPMYMNLNSHAHPYGVFVGGNDMGTSNQTELYCAAFGNGKFIVRGFGPASFRMNGLLGDSNAAVHKAGGRGQPVTQDISLSIRGNKIECSVNGAIVASYNKDAVVGVGKLKSTDGYYGLRFAHNTDVLVTGFTLSKD
jgi:hypothetical protein